MKSIKLFALVIAIGLSSFASATTTPTKGKKSAPTIESTVASLLEKPNFNVEYDFTAKVQLMVNSKNELVVLNVESENGKVERFVKNRLNYKKLPFVVTERNTPFNLPLRLVSR